MFVAQFAFLQIQDKRCVCICLYLWNHQIVDSMDDSAAQSRRGVHVVHPRQRIRDHCEIVRERELHPLLCRAAVLQQSQAGIPVVFQAVGQGEAASHVLDELFGLAVVLQSHPLRAIQHEHHIHGPLRTAGHCRLWNRHTHTHVRDVLNQTWRSASYSWNTDAQRSSRKHFFSLLFDFILLRWHY